MRSELGAGMQLEDSVADASTQQVRVQTVVPGNAGALSIVIAATCTADLIVHPFRFWMQRLGFQADIALAPYAQLMQELLNPQSLLSRNVNGHNILLVRLEDWQRDLPAGQDTSRYIEHVRRAADEFVAAMEAMRRRISATTFVYFGPTSSSVPAHHGSAFDAIQKDVVNRLGNLAHLHCWTHDELMRLYPVTQYEDARSDRVAHIPYTQHYFAAISTLMARRIAVSLKPPFKVIAIDCDNTLWKGVCGEDGVQGIELTPSHLELQKMLVRQHDAGVLLCLCTKNNPSDVEAVFRSRPDMLLREEHLVSSRINWSAKSSNLKSLAEEFDLSLESFIFIDDSAMECAEVRSNAPAVLTLQFPHTPEEITHFMHHVWAFDRISVTEDAKRRTEQYRKNSERRKLLQEADGLEQFMASLDLQVDISRMQSAQLQRVAELVQRTNQFNLTGIRRRASEIEMRWKSGDIDIMVVHVKDRFGDYGLVGAVFLKIELPAVYVDTLVISCRALGRGVEHRIVRELGQLARRAGAGSVVLQYRRTARNTPAREFLDDSLAQFMQPQQLNDAESESIFVVPVEFAENFGVSQSAGKVFKDKVDSSESESATPSGRLHEWHEAAYQVSKLPDLMRELATTAPRGRAANTAYVAPRTSLEATVAKIWADVLGLDEISVTADFTELGGDSLLAVQVISAIGSELGLEVSIYDFFECPTVTEVVAKLVQSSNAQVPFETADRSQPLPLSSAQQRLWFIDQLEGGSPAYHIPLAVRLHGTLDRRALQSALDQLLNRHEALRTVFAKLDGEPVQQIAQEERFNLQYSDLRNTLAEEREASVTRMSRDELVAPFDLSKGLLIRGALLQLSDDEHVLLITMHHIVSDGWSISILVREFGLLYEASRVGGSNPLPALSLQYADYAQAQRLWLERGELQEQQIYWQECLSGAPELLELPADRPRPAAKTYLGENIRVQLPADLTASLKSVVRREGITLAMLLHAGWSVLLARLSGQKDIVVGVPVANRRRTELEGLIGLFVNTLAVRVQLQEDPAVAPLLLQTKEAMLRAYENQDIPFEKVVEALKPTRSLGYSPIFQTMFVLHNTPRIHFDMSGLTLEEQEVLPQTAKFDLTLSLREVGDEILGSVNYATDLFDGQTIQRWVACFRSILWGMVRSPHLPVSKLPFISDEERYQVIERFNTTRTPFPQERLVHEFFEEQAVRRPDEIAATFEGQRLTFAVLDARANQLAWQLREQGVGPDQRVALFIGRSLDMIVGLLATLKAGGAYVPMDPNYPLERLRHMIQDAAPCVILTQSGLSRRLPKTSAEVVFLDTSWSEIAKRPTASVNARAAGLRSNHLAYVIYTSGSTGQPKGVMIEHANVLSLWQGLERIYASSAPCRRIGVNASINFDASVKQLIQVLSGRTLVIIPEEIRADATAFVQFIDRNQVDGIDCTPSQLKTLVSAGLLESGHCLRVALVGGEPIDPELWSRLAQCPYVHFYNVYGPTESTVDTTFALLKPDQASPHIGSPMENRQVYILDEHGEPVPIGVAGEIHIGGAGVARGYLNSPEKTSERFLEDPFSTDPQARIYRSGDFARWRCDGVVEYLGRSDHQVKIRGFRVELEDIEGHLLQNALVKDAVVLARDAVDGGKQLVGYVVPDLPKLGANGSTDENSLKQQLVPRLRGELRSRLPEYMIPSAWRVLRQLPLTSNGKVDRSNLPAPLQGRSEDSGEYVPPATELESTLADLWRRLLGVDQVGVKDNFFDLGGHSLLVIKAMFEINKSVGCKLKVADVYGNPTVRELAARIRGETIEENFVDLSREAVLDAAIVPISAARNAEPEAIMLTGATGFVGRFLLAQLLNDTKATVYCLVRASSQQQAQSRLKSTLEAWDLWREEFRSRIVAIAGDLRLSRLGIDDRDYSLLAQGIDSIYHCGTSMNHLESYAMAKPASVDAAREILKLATLQRPKVVNYISTLGVFSPDTSNEIRIIDERCSIDHEKHSAARGYTASKWVGEKIFLLASQRGIPCNIFRVGLVWADTQKGRYDELQREYRLIKSCLLSGYGIKNYRYEPPPMPVNYAARAIVSLGLRRNDGQGVFHICSQGHALEDVFERCNESGGTSLKLLPFYEWLCEMRRLHHENLSLPIVPLIEFAFSMSEAEFYEHQRRMRSASRRFDCARTHQELKQAGITLPLFTEDLLRLGLEGMLSREPELQERFDTRDNFAARERKVEGAS